MGEYLTFLARRIWNVIVLGEHNGFPINGRPEVNAPPLAAELEGPHELARSGDHSLMATQNHPPGSGRCHCKRSGHLGSRR